MYGPGLARSLEDAVAVLDEARGLLGGAQLGVRQAEGAHARLGQGVALGRAPADRVVLHEHDPLVAACVRQPADVGDPLTLLLAVDGRERVHDEPVGAQRLGEVLATEASVDEELRRRFA